MGSLTKAQQALLKAALVVLVGGVIGLQTIIDPLRTQDAIEPKKAKNVFSKVGGATLPFEYALGAVSGFRQVIAGLLWVRSDAFFHQGNYDAILPLIRLITWMDPNWLDPYATGAWHLTYNFTDTDQRSDRRYLPAGVALLNEGITNNADLYDMYKEKGWLDYDKIKDYDEAVKALEGGMQHNPDVTQVGHLLAHAYEKAGRSDDAIKQWEKNIELHKAAIAKVGTNDKTGEASKQDQGLKNSIKNLEIVKVRRRFRPIDTKPPVDLDFQIKVVRTESKKLEVSGSWTLRGTKNGGYDVNKGIVFQGPVDGARVDVRLQDAGYTMPQAEEFSFEVDPKLTIMQDQLSTHGGRKTEVGGVFVHQAKNAGSVERNAEKVAVYGLSDDESKGIGVPLDKALAGGAPISEAGKLQLVMVAYPMPYNASKISYDPAEVAPLFTRLKGDTAKAAELTKKGYSIATKAVAFPGEYKREIDMSKDPKMYSFTADKYDLIVSFNPRSAPDFVQDRLGSNGEGMTDKRYLVTVPAKAPKAPLRMIKAIISLTREDVTGEGRKVLWPR